MANLIVHNSTLKTLALANARLAPEEPLWTPEHLRDYESLSDGCSGGLSRLYALGGKNISCHWCCVCHDFLYELGGHRKDRREADQLLRECAACAGKFEGWRGVLRRTWRWFRAWVMYVAVRCFGGRYWG